MTTSHTGQKSMEDMISFSSSEYTSWLNTSNVCSTSTALRSELIRWRRYSVLLCTCTTTTTAASFVTRSNTSRLAILWSRFACSTAARTSERFPPKCENRGRGALDWEMLASLRRVMLAIWFNRRLCSRFNKLSLAPSGRLGDVRWLRATEESALVLLEASSSRRRMLTSTTINPIADTTKMALIIRFGVISGMTGENLQQKHIALLSIIWQDAVI